ncbi:protein BRICK1-like [Ananas comosus]|uniref:Protein BRICK1-like n=1 Tax=Ananas comosus TaxID=4615 RepID=A0A6P5GE24_ANACO|nr:protein BRICK1-like [Ananas comosus]
MLGRKREVVLRKGDGEDSSNTAHQGAVATAEVGGYSETISDFISQSDEASRKRLESMNRRLRELELQMEALEAEITKASSLSGT